MPTLFGRVNSVVMDLFRKAKRTRARTGPLGGPLVVIGAWASLFATCSASSPSGGFRTEPLAWGLLVGAMSMLACSPRARFVLLPLVVLGLCAYESASWGRSPALATAFAAVLLAMLAPLALTSLRARVSRPSTLVRWSHVRSTWCVAFAVAGPIGDWIADLWGPSDWVFGASGRLSLLRWTFLVPFWGCVAGGVALVILGFDLASNATLNRIARALTVPGVPPTSDLVTGLDLGVGEGQSVLPGTTATTPRSTLAAIYRQGEAVSVFGSMAQAKRELRVSIVIDCASAAAVAAYVLFVCGEVSRAYGVLGRWLGFPT